MKLFDRVIDMMNYDNGCKFVVTPAQQMEGQRLCMLMQREGCDFTEHDLEIMAMGQPCERQGFNRYSVWPALDSLLEEIFNGEIIPCKLH